MHGPRGGGRLRVREIGDDEGRRLVQIVRREAGSVATGAHVLSPALLLCRLPGAAIDCGSQTLQGMPSKAGDGRAIVGESE